MVDQYDEERRPREEGHRLRTLVDRQAAELARPGSRSGFRPDRGRRRGRLRTRERTAERASSAESA
ncbi:MAG TPA: hypothetical protein VN837_07250 [Chloroflexota bacterium]|nr:hypothetical protein [Chloroflexota bacterium]